MASQPSLAYQEHKKEEITETLNSMFDTIRQFSEMMMLHMDKD